MGAWRKQAGVERALVLQSVCNSWEGKASLDPLRVLSLDLKIEMRQINRGTEIYLMHFLCDMGVFIKKEKLKETDLGTDIKLGKGCRFGRNRTG